VILRGPLKAAAVALKPGIPEATMDKASKSSGWRTQPIHDRAFFW
jgi:hypothetical protein